MLEREARRRLHHTLIDIQDKPCLWCGSRENRMIDRILEGFRGGKYIMPNVRVLCGEPQSSGVIACHTLRHNKRKFAVGDRVIVNGRCPVWLIKQLRHNRLRTITSVFYDNQKQCCFYYLGINHSGASDDLESYSFRSFMLQHPINRGVGRPKSARKCTIKNHNQNLVEQTTKQVLGYSVRRKLDLEL